MSLRLDVGVVELAAKANRHGCYIPNLSVPVQKIDGHQRPATAVALKVNLEICIQTFVGRAMANSVLLHVTIDHYVIFSCLLGCHTDRSCRSLASGRAS